MVTSVSMHPGAWMDGIQVNAQDLRLQQVSAHLTGASPSGTTGIAARPGVRYGTGSPLLVQASSGMNITVNAGCAFVQGTASATAGMYTGVLDTTGTMTVTTSDPTNPRIDNVIVKFVDNGDNTSTGVVAIQAGTPASSPVAPALPANSLLLATIAVGAGVSSITGANITDGRVYTVATGGILPMKDVTGGITGPAGLYAHDLSTGRLKVSDGSGNARSPKTGAFVPVASSFSDTVVSSAVATTLAVVSVTVDGATEIAMIATWLGVSMSSPSVGSVMAFTLFIDGSQVPSSQEIYYRHDSTSTNIGGGGMLLQHTTPSAGTHTVALMGVVLSAGSVFTARSAQIVVRPAFV